MKKRIIKSIILIALAVLMLLSLASCAGDEERVSVPVLECGDKAIDISMYEFLLSRMKGNLARNKYEVNDPEFWQNLTESGESYEDYYNRTVLENCKRYLAASVIFEREGLTLPQSVIDAVDEEIAFYIDYDGKGDEHKFNEILKKYGADTRSLREIYLIEKEYELVLQHLYGNGSLISDSVKEEFYKDNYVRFKQILFPKFYYEYERDSEGNIIYFDTESGKPLYDSEKGNYAFDENDNFYRDDYGCVIYFDSKGNILYDTNKGQPSVITDESGEGVKHYYSENELEKFKLEAEALSIELGKGNTSAFEAEMNEHINILGADQEYSDGYYLSLVESRGYEEYLTNILAELQEMEEGEISAVESEHGYHVIMKYSLDSGKYSDSAYSEWFVYFTGSLINELFLDKLETVIGEISVNVENLSSAESITALGIDFDY